MCEGCHKASCGESCAVGTVMGGSKSVTVTALNAARADIGDTVELESRDGTVLLLALAVFIFPLVLCAAMYALGRYVLAVGKLSLVLAAGGFCLSYVALGALERRCRRARPDVTVVRVIARADTPCEDAHCEFVPCKEVPHDGSNGTAM